MNSDYKDFAIDDNRRSIPSITDGWKPTQRKIIYALIKRGESSDAIKVASLAGSLAEVAEYHHGDASGVAIKMAQNFPGSNNVNFLEPEGQFGTILSYEAAAARYIFTRLNENFRKYFKKDDDCILEFQFEGDKKIEPQTYIPILPTVLINGSSGMGNGFATNIFCYNPQDLKDLILDALKDGKKLDTAVLTPWYRGYNGAISRNDRQIVFKGSFVIQNTTTIRVTELPVGTELEQYKKRLIQLEDEGFIKSFEDNSTESGFDFTLTVPRTTTVLDNDKLETKLGLVQRDSENFTLWTEDGKMMTFDSAVAIVKRFLNWRLAQYEKRRLKQIDVLEEELKFNKEKQRFIEFYIKNSQLFSQKKKPELEILLKQNNFTYIEEFMNLKIYNLTYEDIEKLKNKIVEIEKKLAFLKSTTAKEIYLSELEELKV